MILFVLNPGSTSTKTALFRDGKCLFRETAYHSDRQIQKAVRLADQLPMRLTAVKKAYLAALNQGSVDSAEVDAFVGRGGLLHSIPSGTYRVNQAMLDDLHAARYGEHASNLGAIIAARLAEPLACPAFVVDPPSVDEMDNLARYTGLPTIRRRSAFHALNQKAAARLAAAGIGRSYQECSMIVAHLGGGISVAAHQNGRVIDVNDALEEGPFSPERAGSLPSLQLLALMCESGKSVPDMQRLLTSQSGLFAYTGTTDCRIVEDLAQTRMDYRELLQAMAYQIAKSIAALSASLSGHVDMIVLTGGLAYSRLITDWIKERVYFLGPIQIIPGEHELEALAAGAERVLRGEEEPRIYEKEA
ncbi:MAG: butyrate kinase [Clostridiaceae bacterium]|nr:butyrate kinase [Clostridiaceae bacterium]